jgi:precorrin-4/cobalt-precorrin-4 C11-methyltransferase
MKNNNVQVYFIGAGPGDPDLITIKGRILVEQADLVLYAGSLVPASMVTCAKKNALVMDSSGMTLDETHRHIVKTVKDNNGMVARLHTGDPTLYGAIHEQINLLERDGISYKIVPGVSVAFAAAARARLSFTLPEHAQSLILTRVSEKTHMPEKEALRLLASHRCSMAIYLSATSTEKIKEELISGGYDENTRIFVGYRIGWPDEKIFFSTLSTLVEDVKNANIKRQTVFLVCPHQDNVPPSRLYDRQFSHGFRKADK